MIEKETPENSGEMQFLVGDSNSPENDRSVYLDPLDSLC